MEKSQFDLCLRVLRKLHKAGVLSGVIIIGSWALYFYKFYFNEDKYVPEIRTRDIDFLVPLPPRFKNKTDIPEMLEELGFIINFKGEGGYIRLDHPELIVEFLIPEMGKGREKPYPLPNLGLNAQPLRFLSFLTEHTVSINFDEMKIVLPHPAAYALHKLIIFDRRKSKDKSDKDRLQAINILNSLEKLGENELISILT